MYYPDLSNYEYSGRTTPSTVNVGWLETGQTWPNGDFPEREQVLNKLKSMERVNICRGFHCCDVCNAYEYRIGQKIESTNRTGNGEYRFTYKGKTYVAPAMIIHYIEEHMYLPPREFIEAVINTI